MDNWARTVTLTEREVLKPESEAQVVEAIKSARAHGERIRLVGSGHSWSDIHKEVGATTPGRLMSLVEMGDVLSLDEQAMTVTFQGGCRIWQLNIWLGKRGYALPYNISTRAPSYVGAAATASHSTSKHFGNLATLMESMRLVDGQGNVHLLDKHHRDWPAVCIGLGSVGVVTECTVKVQKRFKLLQETKRVPFEEFCNNFEKIYYEHDFVKVYWFPGEDDTMRILTWDYLGADAEVAAQPQVSPLKRWFEGTVVNKALAGVNAVQGLLPKAAFDWVSRATLAVGMRDEKFVGDGDKILQVSEYGEFVRHFEMEYAMEFEKTAEVLRATRDLVRKHGLRINYPLELRLVLEDDFWMSSDYKRRTIRAGAYTVYAGDSKKYFEEFEKAMLKLGGRPHWGKEFFAKRDRIEGMFPMFGRFQEVCRKYDPEGVFTSEFTESVLGLGRVPTSSKYDPEGVLASELAERGFTESAQRSRL